MQMQHATTHLMATIVNAIEGFLVMGRKTVRKRKYFSLEQEKIWSVVYHAHCLMLNLTT